MPSLPEGATLFGRPIVMRWDNPATREVTFENDEGKKFTFSEEQLLQQFHQFHPQ